MTETDEVVKSREQYLLRRCIFGSFGKNKDENHTLMFRRWPSTEWKKDFGFNTYEMLDGYFLFEFPNTWRNRSSWENGYGRETKLNQRGQTHMQAVNQLQTSPNLLGFGFSNAFMDG